MNDHYIVTADQGHLRIYVEHRSAGQSTVGLVPVEGLDFPAGKNGYVDRDTDMAGRFASSKHQSVAPGSPGARTGMSIDERLPMKREEERRRVKEIAAAIDRFLRQRPDATWDFAAASDLNQAVLDGLSPDVRKRLHRAIPKDLVNQPVESVREHFVGA